MTSHFEPVLRLPNMQDVGPETLDQRDAFIKTLRGVLSLRGYERAETPILEQTELIAITIKGNKQWQHQT